MTLCWVLCSPVYACYKVDVIYLIKKTLYESTAKDATTLSIMTITVICINEALSIIIVSLMTLSISIEYHCVIIVLLNDIMLGVI
jgi:hypothetical protein